jgi:hypothetical protein
MSYFVEDANGYVDEMTTVAGLAQFRDWAEKHPGPIADFVEAGTTDEPKKLADALDVVQADDPNVRETAAALAVAARDAEEFLTLTDGSGDTSDDEEPAVARDVQLTVAAGYKTRREMFDGREHLVVPVVALMQGVVHAMNAKCAEFVPAEELRVRGWNGRPVFLNHPVDATGAPVSGNDPKILEKQRIGWVQNTKVRSQKLLMEAWLDIERCEKIAPTLLARVEADEPIEISVGVFTDTDDDAGEYAGKRYAGVWRDLVPDHLAILDEEHVGACSIDMGCGVRAAGAAPMYLEWIEPADDNTEFLRACRNISQDERDKMPAEDFAGPNRSFPIQQAEDVSAASHALGRAKGNRDTIKRKIIAIAYRKGFDAQLPDDWKKKKDVKGASIFARLMEAFRVAQPANKMGANDLQRKLMEAVQEKEPGMYCSYVDSFPVTDPSHVVYSCYENTAYPSSGYQPWMMVERSFTLDADGVVTVSDSKVEVEAVVNYEPVEGAQPIAASQNAVKGEPCSCKSTSPKAAVKQQGEVDMKREELVKFLEKATDEQVLALSTVAEAKPAVPAVPVVAEVKVKAETPKALSEADVQTMIKAGVDAGIKALTFDQVLEKADPSMRDAINTGKTVGDARKESTIKSLKATGRCKYSDEELKAMSQKQLDNLVELAGSNVRAAIDYSAQGAPKDNAPKDVEKITIASQNEVFAAAATARSNRK